MRHGGAWRRTWRIPFVFACPEHRCLLSDRCPQCRSPLPGATGLIHRPGEVLHPASCRATDPKAKRDSRNSRPCCRFRLDSAPPHPIEPSLAQDLLELQGRILNSLLADTPEQHVTFGIPSKPETYLADLRLTMILIQQTWPTIRDLDRPARLTEIMDHHVETAPIVTTMSQSIPRLTIAPEDEYDPEVRDLLELVNGQEDITDSVVSATWLRWFGASDWPTERPEEITAVSAGLNDIRREFRTP